MNYVCVLGQEEGDMGGGFLPLRPFPLSGEDTSPYLGWGWDLQSVWAPMTPSADFQ